MVWVNYARSFLDPRYPLYGGMKDPGIGREVAARFIDDATEPSVMVRY